MSALEKLIESKGIKMSVSYGAENDNFSNSDGWTCVLHYGKKQMTTPFYQGYGHKGAEPKIASVISSLLMDSSAADMTFEEFCREFGYCSNSRKAEQMYKQCVKLGKRLQNLLGEDYQEFLENNDY